MGTDLCSDTESARPTRREVLLDRTRAEHDALLDAMHQLEAALAAGAPGREHAWGRRVSANLKTVADLLTAHVTSAESPDGLCAEIGLTRPTLARRLERLRREHVDLLQQARELQHKVRQYDDSNRPGFQDIRKGATRLLNALRRHQAAETDLIFESWFTDLGVGD